MRRKITTLLLILFLLSTAGGYTLGETLRETNGTETMAWWSLLYERPNPERLPVKVSFWLASR
ncbi:MAG: hypothetical protein LUE31_05890 [Lachnospiraceae bacterium]|nr:hypothetical protein [Lachnospiraceae bacterium]